MARDDADLGEVGSTPLNRGGERIVVVSPDRSMPQSHVKQRVGLASAGLSSA